MNSLPVVFPPSFHESAETLLRDCLHAVAFQIFVDAE
jgi:hypothetical protein